MEFMKKLFCGKKQCVVKAICFIVQLKQQLSFQPGRAHLAILHLQNVIFSANSNYDFKNLNIILSLINSSVSAEHKSFTLLEQYSSSSSTGILGCITFVMSEKIRLCNFCNKFSCTGGYHRWRVNEDEISEKVNWDSC